MGLCVSTDAEEHIKLAVCQDEELEVGQVRAFKIGGDAGSTEKAVDCLMVRAADGTVSALTGVCTHYGAVLANGSFDANTATIRCPWHGACFSATTGDIEDFPGLDSLQKLPVSVEKGALTVRAAKKDLRQTRRVKPLCSRDQSNSQTIVVVGGGAAAELCVETLRQENRFTGRLVMVTAESTSPYDRPKLSKALSVGVEEIKLRKEDYYKTGDIEIMTHSEVTRVDVEAKKVQLRSGDSLSFDKLVLATGSSPRTMPNTNSLKNIFVLRTPSDANAIAQAGQKGNVVIIGTSFIGMEVAAFFAGKATSVTVVGMQDVPFKASLGDRIGAYLMAMHKDKGVHFEMETSVSEFVGDDDRNVREVVLANGSRLPADVVVLGIGVTPNTAFLADCGIDMTSSGHLIVNEYMETNIKGVYAAGDIAYFPLFFAPEGARAAIGHWQLASAHGRCAALNISGNNSAPIRTVPFFWTTQFGKSLRYAGYSTDHDDVVLADDLEGSGAVVAYFCKGEDVRAVATLMRDPIAAKFANLVLRGETLKKDQIGSDWKEWLG